MTFDHLPMEVVSEETIKRANIEYYNEENPRSMVNIVEKRFKEKLTNPILRKYLLMDEWRLKLKVTQTPTLNRIRIAFWREFDRAQSRQKNIDLRRVLEGICSRDHFNQIVQNVKNLAWILKPPTSYVDAMEEALQFGIDRMREILEAPIYQKKWKRTYFDQEEIDEETGESKTVQKSRMEEFNEFDSNAAALLVKTIALLDQRVKGPTIQRLQIQNQNIPAPREVRNIDYNDRDLDKKLKLLEAELEEDVAKLESPYSFKDNTMIVNSGVKVEEMNHLDAKQIQEIEKKLDEV